MAEKGEGTCDQDLVCPLCLDILEDATLLACQHSFCRRCLRKYDDSQAGDQDHMVCPLCREVTELTETRVAGLSSSVSINGLVDDYVSSVGGMMAILHIQPKCTSCDEQQVAVSFCSDCDMYLCEDCHRGHKKMRFFAKHRVTSMREMEKGESHAYQQYNRCAVHELEKRDLFCDDCRVLACLKCVVVNHRDHRIKNKEDFEKEMRLKMNDLGLRCCQEKDRLEKNIHRVEKDRQDMHLTIKNLEVKVKKEHEVRVLRLKEKEKMLLAKIESLKKGFDDECDDLKAAKRQRIKSMMSSLTLVMVDRLTSLEGENLSAHTCLCNDLEKFLKETSDESTGCVKQKAESIEFHLADEQLLCLGRIEQTATLVREFELPGDMSAIAAVSQEAVVVGYGDCRRGTDCFFVSGDKEQHMSDDVGNVHGLAFLSDGRLVVSHDEKCSVYNTPEALNTGIEYMCTESENYVMLCSDQQDNIYAVNTNTEIYHFYGDNPNPQRVIPTGNFIPEQICVTKTGVMISSSCNNTSTPSKVTVYDREGHVGSSITVSDFECDEDVVIVDDDDGDVRDDADVIVNNGDGEYMYLYAAVDSQDRVLVAWVGPGSNLFDLNRYTLQGNKLVKQTVFKQLEFPHPIDNVCGWCYMVSLTPNLMAFASGNHLYFIKV